MPVSVKKVSVAIGADELEWARGRAEREGTSLSSVLTQAARAAREAEAHKRKQQAAWSAFVKWATAGKGVAASSVQAAKRELGLK